MFVFFRKAPVCKGKNLSCFCLSWPLVRVWEIQEENMFLGFPADSINPFGHSGNKEFQSSSTNQTDSCDWPAQTFLCSFFVSFLCFCIFPWPILKDKFGGTLGWCSHMGKDIGQHLSTGLEATHIQPVLEAWWENVREKHHFQLELARTPHPLSGYSDCIPAIVLLWGQNDYLCSTIRIHNQRLHWPGPYVESPEILSRLQIS